MKYFNLNYLETGRAKIEETYASCKTEEHRSTVREWGLAFYMRMLKEALGYEEGEEAVLKAMNALNKMPV